MFGPEHEARHGLPPRMNVASRTFAIWLLVTATTLHTWAAPRKPTEHVVQSGQTLAKIAKRYHLTVEELCEANDLKRSSPLKLGQRLALPTDEDDESAATARGRQRDTADPPSSALGRGSGTAQKAEQLRHGSFSRYLAPPAKRGFVHILGFHGEYKGQLLSKSGKLMPKAAIAISRVLAWPRTEFVMDKRLLTLLGRVSDAFGGRTLRIVSGYRTTSFASESKHPLGRACDFSILGVPNTALRDYVRTFHDVGVGYYPNSTFIHLDVRDYDAYWVDYAGPGEAPRYRNRIAKKASRHDDEPDVTQDATKATREQLVSVKSSREDPPKDDADRATLAESTDTTEGSAQAEPASKSAPVQAQEPREATSEGSAEPETARGDSAAETLQSDSH
jgi:LysM repeat protein